MCPNYLADVSPVGMRWRKGLAPLDPSRERELAALVAAVDLNELDHSATA